MSQEDKTSIKQSLLSPSQEDMESKKKEQNFEFNTTKFGNKQTEDGAVSDTILLIEYESLKKRVTHFSFFAIIINLILFCYVGPTPMSRQMSLEIEEMSVGFYCWDTVVVVFTTIFLILGVAKRTIYNTSELAAFKKKLIIMIGLQVIDSFLMVIFAGVHMNIMENFAIRLFTIAINLVVYVSVKGLEEFVSTHKPINLVI